MYFMFGQSMDIRQQRNHSYNVSPTSDNKFGDSDGKYINRPSIMTNLSTLNEKSEGEVNLGYVPDERRRVSIASEAVQADLERNRKLSAESQDSGRKSAMANGDGLKALDGDKIGVQNKGLGTMRRSNYESIEDLQDVRNSWWFDLCTKCRKKESGAGWEPSYWSYLCPYPFCPTYRHVARSIALLMLGLMSWGILYALIGPDVGPGGQLFDIAVLCISAHLGGWAFRMLNLPALVGMLIVGIIYQNIGLINIHGPYVEFVSVLRRIALVMILIRAGLDLDPPALTRLFFLVLRMGLIPWLTECLILMVLAHYFLHFPWIWGLLMGSIIAAVAPAVVVPCLFRIRSKGYGVAKGIPTLIIAVSGIDDAASVAAFGIIYGVMFSNNSLAFDLVMGPLSILFGIFYGFFWYFIAKYIPEKEDPFVVPLRILLLLGAGLIAVLGSEFIEMAGAGPLGCISAAYMCIWVWSKQGWDIEDNPVATAFEIFWMIFEPILFSLTGTQIKINAIDPKTFYIGTAIIVTAVVARIIVTLLVGIKASLNTREKIFIAISWMAKASVQAALGPVALHSLKEEKNTPEHQYAEVLLMMCIISIILTAPLGAIIVTLSGTRLLTKTSTIPVVDGWRRNHRPSLRHIQIAEEDEQCECESIEDKSRKSSATSIGKVKPSVVITMEQ